MRKVYFWRRLPNFGDELNWFLMRQLDVDADWGAPADADLVMVGSILEHLPKGWSGTVCGIGQLREETRADLSNARVLALRGKLTAERVKGLPTHTKVVLGDPGLLVSKFVPQPVAKYELGIVPHWSDKTLAKRFPHGHLIDPQQPPDQVIAEIARCKRVISSSLHGLIVADSYGIPRQAEIFPQAVQEGGDFKFRDYASVFGTHPHFGEMWKAPHDIVERIIEELWEVLQVAIGRARPRPQPRPEPEPNDGPCPQISLLVPFRDNGEYRTRVWNWLRKYWAQHLPSVEVVQGWDGGTPFSKSVAVNDAASRARGRVFVILDADAYMDAHAVQECADNIESAVAAGKRLWYMPYHGLYRLNEKVTLELLRTNPHASFCVKSPPPEDWLEPGRSHHYGHQYGAMMQIMPREAFFTAGGFDPRFRGWGSEDASFMRAVDTLYAPHELADNDLLHLWHTHEGNDWRTRRWVGQARQMNSRLAQRYAWATGEAGFMRALVEEHVQPVALPPCVDPKPPVPAPPRPVPVPLPPAPVPWWRRWFRR